MRECELSPPLLFLFFLFSGVHGETFTAENVIRPAMNLILFDTVLNCNISSVPFLISVSFFFFFLFFSFFLYFLFLFFCSFKVWIVGANAILTFRADLPVFKLYIRLLVLAHLSSEPRRTEGAIIFLFCWRFAISFPLEGQRDSIIIVRFIPSELSGLLSPF